MTRTVCFELFWAALVLGQAGFMLAQEDVADIPGKRVSLADPNLSYFLIGPTLSEVPPDGYGLIVIMPGGDGRPDFLPFVKRICKYALSKNYVAVQPIAPKWSPEQKVVWPTGSDNLAYVKVTTEQFVDAIVRAVRGQYKIDSRRGPG